MIHPWNDAEIEYLKANFAENLSENIAKVLYRSITSVRNKAYQLGLEKNPAFLREISSMHSRHPDKIAHWFKPGFTPANKGKKMPDELKAKVAHTFFKAGHLPHNTRQDGDIQKRSGGYWYIRVSLANWRQLHTYTWEQANRPILPGEMVKFRDGDKNNCSLGNLYLSNRVDNMKANTIQRYPTELKQTIRTIAKFERKLKQHEKRHHSSAQSPDSGDGTHPGS